MPGMKSYKKAIMKAVKNSPSSKVGKKPANISTFTRKPARIKRSGPMGY